MVVYHKYDIGEDFCMKDLLFFVLVLIKIWKNQKNRFLWELILREILSGYVISMILNANISLELGNVDEIFYRFWFFLSTFIFWFLGLKMIQRGNKIKIAQNDI